MGVTRRFRTSALALLVVLAWQLAPAAEARQQPAHPDGVALDLANLVPLRPSGITFAITKRGEPQIRFDTAIANRGQHALDLVGVAQADGSVLAYQCVRWAAPMTCLLRRPAGTIVWHPAHAHFHFTDFARFELRRLRGGSPDMSPGGLVSSSEKVSFCLMDVRADRSDREPWYERPSPMYSNLCAAGSQGLSPGWRDVYDAATPGQSLSLAGVADGAYALVVTVDPLDRLAETRTDDNVAWRTLKLVGGRPT